MTAIEAYPAAGAHPSPGGKYSGEREGQRPSPARRLRAVLRRLMRFARAERGSATIEFVVVVPVIFTIFMSSFEVGLIMTRQAMLDRAVDMTVRAVRLSASASKITHTQLRNRICDYAGILPDCRKALKVELTRISTSVWNLPKPKADCIDRTTTVNPVTRFVTARASDIIFLRACYVADPLFPLTGLATALPKDASGGYHLISTAIFATEPE